MLQASAALLRQRPDWYATSIARKTVEGAFDLAVPADDAAPIAARAFGVAVEMAERVPELPRSCLRKAAIAARAHGDEQRAMHFTLQLEAWDRRSQV